MVEQFVTADAAQVLRVLLEMRVRRRLQPKVLPVTGQHFRDTIDCVHER